MSPFVPSFIEVATPQLVEGRVAIVAHGILGSASNWRGFFRKLVESDELAATVRWILVDLRHHGGSAGSLQRPSPPDTVGACARDLVALTESLGVSPMLTVGHSFGGKVVLAHADLVRKASGRPRAVWLLDSSMSVEDVSSEAARDTATTGDDVVRVIAALRGVEMPLTSRDALVETLRAQGFSLGLAQWMTTNLEGTVDEGYRWRFDLDGIEALIADYFATDAWVLANRLANAPDIAGMSRTALRVVRGGRSDRVPLGDVARLEAMAGAAVHTLPNAGHWLHVDDPDGLRALMSRAVGEAVSD